MNQPSVTILWLSAHRLVRADFDLASSTIRQLWTEARPPALATEGAVRSALKFGGKAGRQVWVLCDDPWMQNVELARNQLTSLSLDQLRRALSFEIEPFSGIPVGESVVGFRENAEQNGLKSFWVIELSLSVRDAVQRVVKELGGRLAGICHPGGVPLPLGTGHSAGWRRLEAWPGGMLSVEAETGQRPRTRVLNTAPALASFAGSPSEFLSPETAEPPATPLDASPAWERFPLSQDDALRGWLSAWATSLRTGHPEVPVIAPAPPQPTPHKYIFAGVILEAIVLLLCLLDGWFGGRKRTDLKLEQAALLRANAQIQERTKTNTGLLKELGELHGQEEKRQQLATRRSALPALLRALSVTRPEDIVLNRIQANHPSGLIISGLALEASSVDEMSIALTALLRPAGWFAHPLQKTAQGTLPNAGPWEFSVSVSQESAKPALTTPPPRAR